MATKHRAKEEATVLHSVYSTCRIRCQSEVTE